MRAVSFVSYLCGAPTTPSERAARDFIRAVKGASVAGSLNRFDSRDTTQATDWFGQLAALVLITKNLPSPIVMSPIPDSDCTLASGKLPSTARLAHRVAYYLRGAVVADSLRWKKAVRRSHQGGGRNPQEIYENFAVIGPIHAGTWVLVDDVLTSGSHVRAAAAKVRSAGQFCPYAVCVGRTTSRNPQHCFSIVEEKLRDFHPTDSRSVD